MFQKSKVISMARLGTILCVLACSSNGNSLPPKAPPAPEMPADWEVVSDLDVPAEQVAQIGRKLGVDLSSLRNTLYEVKGKRVQLNVLVTRDAATAEQLMTKLRSMKSEEALLKKGRIVYEFVGKNDVLPMIAEGRQHLDSK